MRTTIELSDQTYTRLRAAAAELGMRGFSSIVEEAIVRLLELGDDQELALALAEAEGARSKRGRGSQPIPSGLATVAGALADWDELDDVVTEIYASRRTSTDRPAPDLD